MSGGRESPNGKVVQAGVYSRFSSRATRAAQRAWRPGHSFLLLTIQPSARLIFILHQVALSQSRS